MRYLIALLLILKITNSYAQEDRADACYVKLTQNHTQNSRVFHLNSAEIDEYDVLNEENATMVVDYLLQKEINCQLSYVIHPSMQLVSCHNLRYSNVCQVTTRLGYFIVQRAAYGSFDHNIIWTRWD